MFNFSPFNMCGKPYTVFTGSRNLNANVLREMLTQAKVQEKKINDMMKILPSETLEYDLLIVRLSKIGNLILQLNQQIIERESR